MDPVLDSYGPKKNSRFLLSFGFISDKAPDLVKLQFPPKTSDIMQLLYSGRGSSGVVHQPYSLSSEALLIVRDLISSLQQVRDTEWGRRAKEYALTGDLDNSAATLVTTLLISKDANDLKSKIDGQLLYNEQTQ